MPVDLQTRPRIAIWAAPREVFHEASAALAEALESRCFQVSVVSDVRALPAHADLILIAGRVTDLDAQQCHVFRRLATQSHVALWQLEALPPPGAPPVMHELGIQVTEPRWAHLFGLPGAVADRVLSPKGELKRIARGWLAQKYRRRLNRLTALNGRQLDKNDLSFVYRQATGIEQHVVGPDSFVHSVICSCASRLEYLAGVGIAADLMPVPSSKVWGTAGVSSERDIDVVLMGHHRTRARRRLWRQLEQSLRASGLSVEVVSGGLYGKPRQRFLGRAKVTIQAPSLPWDFPGIRMLLGIQNGVLVISTTEAYSTPYQAGVHYLSVAERQLVPQIIQWVKDDSQRRHFVSHARKELQRLSLPELAANRLRRIIGNRQCGVRHGTTFAVP